MEPSPIDDLQSSHKVNISAEVDGENARKFPQRTFLAEGLKGVLGICLKVINDERPPGLVSQAFGFSIIFVRSSISGFSKSHRVRAYGIIL